MVFATILIKIHFKKMSMKNIFESRRLMRLNSFVENVFFDYNKNMIEKIINSILKTENEAAAIEKKGRLSARQIEQKNQLDIDIFKENAAIKLKNEIKEMKQVAEEESKVMAQELAKKNQNKKLKQDLKEKEAKAKKFIITEFYRKIEKC